MKTPIVVSTEFINTCYLFLDLWKKNEVNSIGHTYFLENDYYLEIAAKGRLILCKNGVDPKQRIRANTYKDHSPSGIAKMLTSYLAFLEKENYWG